MDTREPTHTEVDRDTADLAKFGYKQELKRTLGTFSSFAVAFSYISPSTGIFTLFFLGMGALGGFLWWTWPVVAFGQLIVALNFAELSSHYPVAGSVFQWTKYLAGRTYAWFTGWMYLFAGILTVASVCATLPIALLPALNNMFGWHLNTALGSTDQKVVALVTLAAITLLNIYGVRLVAIVNNTGVVFEILGMVVFAIILAVAHNNSGVGVIFHSDGAKFTLPFFLVGMFMSLYVIYGFDTASTLAEETKNPRVEAPKAVLASVVGAFIIGTIFLLALIIAIPDMQKFVAGAGAVPATITSPADVLNAVLPGWMANVYLLVVLAAIYVCCLAIQTSTIRLAFGMARDGKLPLARFYNKVSPTLHTPVITCLVVGAMAALPFIYYAGAGLIAIVATGMIYLSYLLGNIAILLARLRGWPTQGAPFKLGGWGLIVNLLGLAWGGSMLVNFLWPRPASNPSVNIVLAPGGASLGGFGDSVPIFELVVVLIVVIGAVYYFVAQRGKTDQVVRAA